MWFMQQVNLLMFFLEDNIQKQITQLYDKDVFVTWPAFINDEYFTYILEYVT